MRGRLSTAVVMCMALAGLAAAASPAGAHSNPKAGHFRMLAFRPRNEILVAGDFLDNLEEISPRSVTSASGVTAEVSTCKYASTAEIPASGEREFTNGEIGIECLANGIKLIEDMVAGAPKGGCYRIDNATALFAYGRSVEKLASKLQKGTKASNWPANFGRYVLKGVGNRAEFGYEAGGNGHGYLQVDNATLLVETSEGANPPLIKLLKDAASLL
jgi:hypothetical protein